MEKESKCKFFRVQVESYLDWSSFYLKPHNSMEGQEIKWPYDVFPVLMIWRAAFFQTVWGKNRWKGKVHSLDECLWKICWLSVVVFLTYWLIYHFIIYSLFSFLKELTFHGRKVWVSKLFESDTYGSLANGMLSSVTYTLSNKIQAYSVYCVLLYCQVI